MLQSGSFSQRTGTSCRAALCFGRALFTTFLLLPRLFPSPSHYTHVCKRESNRMVLNFIYCHECLLSSSGSDTYLLAEIDIDQERNWLRFWSQIYFPLSSTPMPSISYSKQVKAMLLVKNFEFLMLVNLETLIWHRLLV